MALTKMNIEAKQTSTIFYQFLIFRRNSLCYYFHSFNNTPYPPNLFGTVFALKNIVLPFEDQYDGKFISFQTDSYKCHYFETLTGFYFVLLTYPTEIDFSEKLKKFYCEIFSKYAVTYIDWNPFNPHFDSYFTQRFLQWISQAYTTQ